MSRQNTLFIAAGLCFLAFLALPFVLPPERERPEWLVTCDPACERKVGAEGIAFIASRDCEVLRAMEKARLQPPDPAYLDDLQDPQKEIDSWDDWRKALQDRIDSLKCPRKG